MIRYGEIVSILTKWKWNFVLYRAEFEISNRSTQRLVSGNVCSKGRLKGLNHLRYSDFIAVKTSRFLLRNITPDFRNKRTYLFLLFSEGQRCRLEYELTVSWWEPGLESRIKNPFPSNNWYKNQVFFSLESSTGFCSLIQILSRLKLNHKSVKYVRPGWCPW